MTSARHAALCTCAPSILVDGAFCRHLQWKWVGVHAPGGEPAQNIYQCTKCGAAVNALPETDA